MAEDDGSGFVFQGRFENHFGVHHGARHAAAADGMPAQHGIAAVKEKQPEFLQRSAVCCGASSTSHFHLKPQYHTEDWGKTSHLIRDHTFGLLVAADNFFLAGWLAGTLRG